VPAIPAPPVIVANRFGREPLRPSMPITHCLILARGPAAQPLLFSLSGKRGVSNGNRACLARSTCYSFGSRLVRNSSGTGGPHRCGGTSQSFAIQQSRIWSMSLNHSIQLPHGSAV